MINIRTIRIENFCCIEKAMIGLASQGLVLVVGNNLDTDAADSNGSGKSTIPKALTWCLFGDTIDGDKHDEVIRWGAKSTEVVVSFVVGGDPWMVKRQRKKGKPSLSLCLNNEDWKGDSKQVQAKIVDLLGLDFRGFCNTVLYGQNDINRFFSSTDTTRKETLHRVLRTDYYRKAERWARDTVTELKEVHREAAGIVTTVKGQIEEHDVEELKRNRDEWDRSNEERVKELTDSVAALMVDTRAAESDVEADRIDLGNQILKAGQERREFEVLVEELREKERERDDLRDECDRLNPSFNELDREFQNTVKALDKLNVDECPVCTSSMKKGAPAKYIKRLTDTRDRLAPQRDSVMEARQTALNKHAEAARRCRELSRADKDLAETTAEIAELTAARDKLDSELKTTVEVLKTRAKEAVEQAKKLREEPNPYEEQIERSETRLAELQAQLQKMKDEVERQETEIAHFEFWVRGFGVRGLPSLLLDSTMPYISERANHYLDTLTDGDITVDFSTTKELKSRKGEMRDEIDISWTIEGVPDVSPSNGQKRKLEVATDLALMDLVAAREDSGISLLFMDEVLDGLDAEGVSRVLRLLQKLRSRRPSIFVVTHEAGLAESFEKVLKVTKEGQSSTVEVPR